MRYLSLAGLLLSGFAVAGDTEHVRMKFEINDESGNVVSIDSDTMDFDMTEMQVGENRSFVDDAGRNVLMTRTESGFELNVDGKTVELPHFDGAMRFHEEAIVEGALAEEIAAQIAGSFDVDTDVTFGPASDGFLMLTDEAIDPETQQAIRDALAAGGYDSDVKFVESDGHAAMHRAVHVIKKEDVIEQ